jgi:hypothetical protein
VTFVVHVFARIRDFVWPPGPGGGWGNHHGPTWPISEDTDDDSWEKNNGSPGWPISQDTEDDEWAGV